MGPRAEARGCDGGIVVFIVSFLLVAVQARATVRLPTDGYVRPGRYFPVEVSSDAHLRAAGCLPCDVTAAGRATVPMLAVAIPGPLSWGEGTAALRVPGDHERLVGATSGMPDGLFPGERIIPVRLDPADPLPGPAAAWEVLDAVVLDPAAMAALGEARRSALLAGGVTLAVSGDAAPDDRWRRRGALWVLSYAPAGPTGVMAEGAYAPTEAWTPGWSDREKWIVVAVGTSTCVLTTAAIAWPLAASRARSCGAARDGEAKPSDPRSRKRPDWGLVVAIGIPFVATGGILIWRSRLNSVAYGGGDVTVSGHGWRQRDTWVYERARMEADVVVPWKGWTHPVFASEEAADVNQARLTVAADGTLAFAMHLNAGSAMAFVRRDVGLGEVPPVSGEQGAAMRGIAPLYLSAGDKVAGETTASPGRWAGVAIVRP